MLRIAENYHRSVFTENSPPAAGSVIHWWLATPSSTKHAVKPLRLLFMSVICFRHFYVHFHFPCEHFHFPAWPSKSQWESIRSSIWHYLCILGIKVFDESKVGSLQWKIEESFECSETLEQASLHSFRNSRCITRTSVSYAACQLKVFLLNPDICNICINITSAVLMNELNDKFEAMKYYYFPNDKHFIIQGVKVVFSHCFYPTLLRAYFEKEGPILV